MFGEARLVSESSGNTLVVRGEEMKLATFQAEGGPRLGLVVEKRFWKAVQRNRIKRRLREWFRLHKHTVPLPGLDIVVIARPGAEHFSTPQLADLFRECFRKGGLRMA